MSVARCVSLLLTCVCFGCFEQIEIVSTKFRHVIARVFGVF